MTEYRSFKNEHRWRRKRLSDIYGDGLWWEMHLALTADEDLIMLCENCGDEMPEKKWRAKVNRHSGCTTLPIPAKSAPRPEALPIPSASPFRKAVQFTEAALQDDLHRNYSR